MEGSNSENNVTAQVFASMVYTSEGRRVLGEWLSGVDGARVRSATLFWFPLRDTIANYYYNMDRHVDPDRWPGYESLFTALGFEQKDIASLPPGHPKNSAWRPTREVNFYAEVVAELASTEFDAAFHVDAGGYQHLFLTESKWLSGLGIGARGLNQVQRGVALALWMKQLFPQTEVTYLVCSKSGQETTDSHLKKNGWQGGANSFTPLMEQFAHHLTDAVEASRVKLPRSKSWKSLGIAISNHTSLKEVSSFVQHHGRGRKYRGHPAVLTGD